MPLVSASLPRSLVTRLQNAAAFLIRQHGSSRASWISGVITAALLRYLNFLEREHNNGRPFPSRARPNQLVHYPRRRKKKRAG